MSVETSSTPALDYAAKSSQPHSSLALAALVLALVAPLLMYLGLTTLLVYLYVAGLGFSVVAAITGFLALRRVDEHDQRGFIMSIAGMVLGIITFLAGILIAYMVMQALQGIGGV